jgi:hypothetical protein
MPEQPPTLRRWTPLQTLARWIVQEVNDPLHFRKYQRTDHACAQCVPGGDMLVEGYQCGRHMAEVFDRLFNAEAGLQPFDLHGTDEEGLYHPPSRAAYDELVALAREAARTKHTLDCALDDREMFKAQRDVARAERDGLAKTHEGAMREAVHDMHGIDDAGVYHPPSRARYEAIIAERDEALEEITKQRGQGRKGRDALIRTAHLEKQVDELQARSTELETERRMWNARYTALASIYQTILLELPVAAIIMRFAGDDKLAHRALLEAMGQCDSVRRRVDLLEKDAWTLTTQAAKEFIKGAEAVRKSEEPDAQRLYDFIDRWRARFAILTA